MERIEKAIEVEAPVTQVYEQWTHFEAFPEFMEGVEEVQRLDERHLHWVAELGGRKEEWDAEILEQVPEQRIAWRSTGGASQGGVVEFEPMDPEHTRVRLQVEYEPEGKAENPGEALSRLSRRMEGDLKRFRDFVQGRPLEMGAWRGHFRSPKIKPRPDRDVKRKAA